jgi:hypothetical protein
MSTVEPAVRPAGESAVIWVAEFTKKNGEATEPNRTAVVPWKLVPVMVTRSFPRTAPRLGLTAVMVGAEPRV